MSVYSYYLRRVLSDSSGALYYDGAARDLEVSFAGLRHISTVGLDAYGEPRVYAETYAEDDAAVVYVPSEGQRQQSELTLTLLFLGDDVDSVESAYHSFVEFISGCQL